MSRVHMMLIMDVQTVQLLSARKTEYVGEVKVSAESAAFIFAQLALDMVDSISSPHIN